MFKSIEPHPDFNKNEEEILKFWQTEKIFEKSVEKNSPDNKFVFYEGPPTANGKPGVHHVLARSFKDIICRYKTMQGYHVRRRAGWDTHGLPVEIEVEKKLGLKNKKEIEDYGIQKFNDECRQSVFRYKTEWEDLTRRIGYWIDLENPYVTYDNSYIENIWGILKHIREKGLIYQDFKVVPYCPRCGTTLSSHEVAQGYKNIAEETIFVKFKVKNETSKYFLVWTTTPWTLPGNVALAVSPKLEYVEAKVGEETFILAKDRLSVLENPEIVKTITANELENLQYEPLYRVDDLFQQNDEKDYRVYLADFVTSDEGTGIVHIAPAFGEDDMELKRKVGLSLILTVDAMGKMLSQIAKGKFIKGADEDIKNDLEKRNLLFKKEQIKHDYPFCWRCDNPLLYYAKSTWFIRVTAVKEELVKNNENINWVPSYIKDGRFGQWLSEARDWALSRERFWGTPLPVWECIEGHKTFIGSVKELEEYSIDPLPKNLDLHRPMIDDIFIKCPECSKKAYRVKEVIDVWFDSGAMPFASNEYPDSYPADYISEAIDQTRGWFYTMLAISTLMDAGTSYKNVICLAHVLDEKGKKMSKSLGNVLDPVELITKFGADVLRWYFYTVNGPGEPKRLSEKNIQDSQRQFLLILWNVYSFFVTYANVDNWQVRQTDSKNSIDRWIKSLYFKLIEDVKKDLDSYDITTAARKIESFVNVLSTWYLRRTRKRRDDDFYSTLYEILVGLTKLLAPFAPFVAESIYTNLKTDKDPASVHLCDYPESGDVDTELISQMAEIKKLVETAHAERASKKIKNRQPLAKAEIQKEFASELVEILRDEINVKNIIINKDLASEIKLDNQITDELKKEGLFRELLRSIQQLRKSANLTPGQQTEVSFMADGLVAEVIDAQKESLQKETATTLKSDEIQAAKYQVECVTNFGKATLAIFETINEK